MRQSPRLVSLTFIALVLQGHASAALANKEDTVWTFSGGSFCSLEAESGGVKMKIVLEPKGSDSDLMNFVAIERPSFIRDKLNTSISWANQYDFDLDSSENSIFAGFYHYPKFPPKMNLKMRHDGGGDGNLASDMNRSEIIAFLNTLLKFRNLTVFHRVSERDGSKSAVLGHWGVTENEPTIQEFAECVN